MPGIPPQVKPTVRVTIFSLLHPQFHRATIHKVLKLFILNFPLGVWKHAKQYVLQKKPKTNAPNYAICKDVLFVFWKGKK